MSRPAATLRALAAALLAAAAGRAGADAAGPLPTRVAERAGRLEVSVDLSAAFPPAVRRQLGNGLTNVVAVWITVVPAGGGGPVALYGRVVDILFDVWEETYAVTVKDPRVPAGVRLVLKDDAALRSLLADEQGIDLGPLAAVVPPEGFVVEARVEVNPVSREQLQRTREYIANPTGARAGGGGSRSVLGAVASYLLRDPEPGSDVRLFRSRAFAPSEVAPR